jgi:WD40 repeat protein
MPAEPENTHKGPVYLFLSYARSDDEPFVRRLYDDLKRQQRDGRPLFHIWFDRESMPSRQLTFHHEIRSAVNTCDRVLFVVGPHAVRSDYVSQEWQFAHFVANKCVNPIVRLDRRAADGTPIDGYELIPQELNKVHAEDFRDDRHYQEHFRRLVEQLLEPLPPIGKLVGIPELPPGFRAQPERLKVLRDLLLADLQGPKVISGARARVGVKGMGGIGKSVLANAMARHPEVRRAFKDGIYWIALGQQPGVAELQRWLARQLGDDGLFENETVGRERLRELLKDREVLLILDNVWERPHAEAFNVIGHLGRLLLTTRDSGLVTALSSHENHYQVNLPSRAEAEELLASAAEVEIQDLRANEAARETVEKCKRLPLALALCGGMVRAGTSWKDVLGALRDHDLAFLSTDHPAEEQHRNIWVAMDVSLRVLPYDQQSRFAELAVFALDTGAVDAAVVTLWEHTGGMSPRESRKLLTNFAQRSLIWLTALTGDGEPAGSRVVLHDLLHSFATGMAVKRLGSMGALHDLLLSAYRRKCPEGWHSGPNDGYFLQNLCRHLIAMERWDELIGEESSPGVLTDLRWVDVRVRAGQVFSVVEEFNASLAELPEFKEEVELDRQRIARCRLYGEELIRHAQNSDVYPLPEPPPTVEMNANEDIPENRSPRAFRLRHFSNFVSGCASSLATFPEHTTEMAGNFAAEGPVAESGRNLLDRSGRPWLMYSPCFPVSRPLRPQCLQTLQGHTNIVTSVSITPDGRRAVSASEDKTLRVWDLQSGQCIQTLEGHTDSVTSVSITPNGRRAVSGSDDRTLRVWDLQSGRCLQTIQGYYIYLVSSVSITPDGKRVVFSGTVNTTLRVWDLQTGQLLQILEGHKGNVKSVSITPNGRRAVSGGRDGTLRVWDLQSGQCIQTLEGHTDSVTSVSITPNGRRVVSASEDKTLRVWDLQTGRCLAMLQASSTVSAVAASHHKWIYATRFGEVRFVLLRNSAPSGPEPFIGTVTRICKKPRLRDFFRIWFCMGMSSKRTSNKSNLAPHSYRTRCPLCAGVLEPSSVIIDTINFFMGKHLKMGQGKAGGWYPPDSAFEDPRLLNDCPHCGSALKFNPFFVDIHESN